MSIEKQFLEKAIKDRNLICFHTSQKKYTKIKPLKLIEDRLQTDQGAFELKEIKKLTLLTIKF